MKKLRKVALLALMAGAAVAAQAATMVFYQKGTQLVTSTDGYQSHSDWLTCDVNSIKRPLYAAVYEVDSMFLVVIWEKQAEGLPMVDYSQLFYEEDDATAYARDVIWTYPVPPASD